jgi:glutamine amidotransferase-like uncharacterized protein
MIHMAIFVDHPWCSVQSANGIMAALPDYRFRVFTRAEVEPGFWHDVNCIVIPGGLGDADRFDRAMQHHAVSIRDHVTSGGTYLGICMGAYWAGSHYLDLLQDLDTVQYIRRPDACSLRPHARAMPVVWRGQMDYWYFYDGCSVIGRGEAKVMARYRSNQDAMAVIQGRVGVMGCHPEATAHWYDSYSWLRGQHRDQTHRLREFVAELLDMPHLDQT